MRDVGKAAKNWPQISFVIYHSAYRFAGGGRAEGAYAQFEKTGRVEWVSDLTEIPEKYGITNVHGDLGQIFAQTTVVEPRRCGLQVRRQEGFARERPRQPDQDGRPTKRMAPNAATAVTVTW